MQHIPILGFAAYSGTGKTTLIEKLVRCLKEAGLRIAVIKHDGHRFEIDKEGKDSWRYTRAGAEMSLICSAEKAALVESRPLDFERLLSFVHDVDLILVEGWKAGNFPQIGISRAATGKGFTHELSHFAAVVTDEDVQAPCPVFGLEETQALARFIRARFLPGAGEDDVEALALLTLEEETLRRIAGAKTLSELARLLGRDGAGCAAKLRVLPEEGALEVSAAAADALGAMEAAAAAAHRVCDLLQALQPIPEICALRLKTEAAASGEGA